MTIYSSRARKNIAEDVACLSSYEIDELIKCHDDPIYFINTYLMLRTASGPMPFTLRPYQEQQIEILLEHGSIMSVQPRQSGATKVPLAFVLWEAIFKPQSSIGIAGIDFNGARNLMSELKFFLSCLPMFMIPNLTYDTMYALEFDTGSKIYCGEISSNFSRGRSFDRVFIDNFAFAKPQNQDDFWMTMIPTLRAFNANGGVIITGCPNGPSNAFARIWQSAINTISQLVPYKVNGIAAHSQQTLDQMKINIGQASYEREYEGSFAA